MKETGWRRGWESPVQPPFLQWLNNILHSELPWGEKGVPFHAEQGVVQEGPSRTFSSSYSHLFLFFSPLSPSLCLFNWTDWPQLSHLQSWGHVGISGNQYCSKGKESCRGKTLKSHFLANTQRNDKQITDILGVVFPFGFHVNYSSPWMNSDSNVPAIRSVWWETSKRSKNARIQPWPSLWLVQTGCLKVTRID